MSLSLDIALAHLAGRKRQTLVSVLGVAMGVGFSIAMSALMQGFQQDFVRRVIENAPHIIMKDEYREPQRQPVHIQYADGAVQIEGLKPRSEIRGIKRAGQIIQGLSEWPELTVSATLQGQIFLRYGGKDRSATLIGIEPDREKRVTKLEKDIVEGSLDALKTASNGIILGRGLARKLGVKVGDTLTAVSPIGVIVKMKVVGLSHTGVVAFDEVNAYALLKKSQILQGRTNVVNQIRIRTEDVGQARAVAARIEARYGYRTESWDETNEGVFGIFVIQNAIMYSTVGAILVVACFGIFNVISTVVFEKTRDIAILKSMGFAEGDVKRIFLYQGFIVGTIGGVIGCLLGLGLTILLSIVRFDVTGVVEVQRFVLKWSAWHYVTASALALGSSMAAAYIPTRRAAKVDPVQIVRGAA